MNHFTSMLLLFCVLTIFFIVGYMIGYKEGFAKCKKIDDEILNKLKEKYKL